MDKDDSKLLQQIADDTQTIMRVLLFFMWATIISVALAFVLAVVSVADLGRDATSKFDSVNESLESDSDMDFDDCIDLGLSRSVCEDLYP